MSIFSIALVVITGQNALMGTVALTSNGATNLVPSQNKVRFRSRVAYDGTNFFGFQVQGDHDDDGKKTERQRSVQGALEAVLFQSFKRPIRVVGAGRTDAGVHSRGQAVHFDLYENETATVLSANNISGSSNSSDTCENCTPAHVETSLPILQSSINQMLSPDVRVWNMQRAPTRKEELVNGRKSVHEWNAMRKCSGKLYSYRLCLGSYMDPIERHGRWQPDWGHEVNDLSLLERVLKRCEGTHDFKCFAGALEQNERKTGKRMGTIRTIHRIELIKEEEEQQQSDLYRIDIYLEGALYKMVRNIVGTALDVCQGRLTEQDFEELLVPREDWSRRNNPCKPAPPQGLSLEHVFYPNDSF